MQPQVLAVTLRLDMHDLKDLKICRDCLQRSLGNRAAMGTGEAHRDSISTAACTAMPSLRPVKPSFSVVVAFTET